MADELKESLAKAYQDSERLEDSPKLTRCRILSSGLQFDESKYEFSDRFVPGDSFESVHTTMEVVQLLERDKRIDVEASVLAVKDGKLVRSKLNRNGFLEHFKYNSKNEKRLREAVDTFAFDAPVIGGAGADYVGAPDYTPLVGGPFYKQLYYYDYIRMHSACFYAYHHDPVGRLIANITTEFSLGKGWRADCDNPIAKMLWQAFEDVNGLQQMFNDLDRELTTYGEDLIWWLPNNQTKIVYRPTQGETVPKGLIPRIRLIDPSCIWDIVTWPEDITRVLFYQWVAPTQYNTYGYDEQTGVHIPTSKFIMQQIPGSEVMHFKLNAMSNEKRGRSDMFPVLGYMKRLRDSVNYSIIGLQKSAAWGIDTTIEGSPEDVNTYVADQQAAGPIAPAGSEFVHTKAVSRQYLSNSNQKGSGNDAFEWALSMISVGTRIPVSYFGTHLSGGQTRASAMIATEPVAKKFETRQNYLRHILKSLAKRLFDSFGIDAEIEFTFPEIVTQDRTAKLKDLVLCVSEKWISQQRAAQIAAKELGIANFDYSKEKKIIEEEQADSLQDPNAFTVNPLSKTGIAVNKKAMDQPGPEPEKPTAVTNQDRKDVKDNRGA